VEHPRRTIFNPSQSKQLRILGGQPVKAGQWPWLGMLLEEDGEYIHMKCGVALICRQWALTSGDCVRELKTGAQYTRRLKFGNMRWDHDRKEQSFENKVFGKIF